MTIYDGFAELERTGWTNPEIATGYIDMFSPASDMAVPAVVSRIPGTARVLDLCCGQGNTTLALIDAGHDVVGADFSTVMLEEARKRRPDATFIEADAQDLPFAAECFDAVTSTFGLMHVPDQPRALREIARVLRPGGRLVMSAWAGPAHSAAFGILYPAVMQNADPSVTMPEQPDFHRFADEDTASGLFSEAGLGLSSIELVPCHWDMDDPARLFEIFLRGAPRGGSLLSRQPEENRNAIRNAMTEAVRSRCAHDGGYRVEIPAAVIVATRDEVHPPLP